MDLNVEPPARAVFRRLEIDFSAARFRIWGEIIRPILIERSCLTSRLRIRNKFSEFKMKSTAWDASANGTQELVFVATRLAARTATRRGSTGE
jgi:hypothetical protein